MTLETSYFHLDTKFITNAALSREVDWGIEQACVEAEGRMWNLASQLNVTKYIFVFLHISRSMN